MGLARNSTKDRRVAFDANKYERDGRILIDCAICGIAMDPVKTTWNADHATPLALDGDALQILCVPCHKTKTKSDVKAIAKTKRGREKRLGIRRSKVPMPFGKMSPYKKKLNGDIVKRDEE